MNDSRKLLLTHNGINTYWNYEPKVMRDVFGNTFAFAMVPMNIWKRIGGLNENYLECFEDVEFNVNCILNGKTNYFIGDEYAIHDESSSRNKSETKMQRESIDFNRVTEYMSKNINEKLIKHIKYRNIGIKLNDGVEI